MSVQIQKTGHAVLFTFHPISGKPDISRQSVVEKLDYDVLSVVMLAQPDDQYLRPLLLLDTQKQVTPQSALTMHQFIGCIMYMLNFKLLLRLNSCK